MEGVTLVQRGEQYARVSDFFHGALSIVGRRFVGYFHSWPDRYWCETLRAGHWKRTDASAAFSPQLRTNRVPPASGCIWTGPGRVATRAHQSPKSTKAVRELKMALSYRSVIQREVADGNSIFDADGSGSVHITSNFAWRFRIRKFFGALRMSTAHVMDAQVIAES